MENFDIKARFAEDVFTDAEMKKRMPTKAYAEYEDTIAKNKPLPLSLAYTRRYAFLPPKLRFGGLCICA